MEKVKLSELLSKYEEMYSKKGEKFELYFEESKIETKVLILREYYKVLGDISLSSEYWKAILYFGRLNQDEKLIKWIAELFSTYENIPYEYLSKLMYCYNSRLFMLYPIKEFLKECVLKYGMSEDAFIKFFEYYKTKEFLYITSDKSESDQLKILVEKYGIEIADYVYRIVSQENIEVSRVLELLPDVEFVKGTRILTPFGYYIYSSVELALRIIMGYVNLNNFKDDEYILLGYTSNDKKIITNFTKKDYLENLKKQEIKKLEKKL